MSKESWCFFLQDMLQSSMGLETCRGQCLSHFNHSVAVKAFVITFVASLKLGYSTAASSRSPGLASIDRMPALACCRLWLWEIDFPFNPVATPFLWACFGSGVPAVRTSTEKRLNKAFWLSTRLLAGMFCKGTCDRLGWKKQDYISCIEQAPLCTRKELTSLLSNLRSGWFCCGWAALIKDGQYIGDDLCRLDISL